VSEGPLRLPRVSASEKNGAYKRVSSFPISRGTLRGDVPRRGDDCLGRITSVVSTVSIDGVSQPGTFTATALFSTLPGQFTFSGTSELVKLTFNPQIASFASSALYLGSAVSWTVAPALIPTGQTVTGVELSLSSSDLKKGSGSYAGTITIDTAAVPEPSSMMMASTAFIALGGLWRLRARRRKA
jgi:hypothetical protein